MVRASRSTIQPTDKHANIRRRHQFTPSVAESASSLEDRVLLSGAGGKAHAAAVARPMADTAAGHRVTAAFESILGTNPSGAQLTQWVHKLHGGVSIKALDRDLRTEVRARDASAATAIAIANDPEIFPATTTSIGSTIRSGGITSMASLPAGLTTLIGSTLPAAASSLQALSQVPAGLSISRAFTVPTPATSTTTTGSTSTTSSSTSTTATASATLNSALTTLQSDLSSSTTTAATLASDISTVATAASRAGLSALTTPALFTTLDSLLTSSALTAITPPGVPPLKNTLLTAGILTETGSTSLNSTNLGTLLGALQTYSNALAATNTTPTSTTSTTSTTALSPLQSLSAAGSVPTPGSTTTTTTIGTTGMIL